MPHHRFGTYAVGVRASAHNRAVRMANRFMFGDRSRKTEPTRGAHLLPVRGMVQPSLLAKRRTTCLVAVVQGRLRQNVSGRQGWEITTKETALFESALDEDDLLVEKKPLLDDSGDFPDAENRRTWKKRSIHP